MTDDIAEVAKKLPTDSGRAPTAPGSHKPSPDGLGPSGFDPSRAWRTDKPSFDQSPIYQFVLLEGFQEHSGALWHRLNAGTAAIDCSPGNRFGYRTSDIDRIQRDGDMICVERVKGWVPAIWPRWDRFLPSDSDGNPKGGDGEAAPSQRDDSAGPKDIAHD